VTVRRRGFSRPIGWTLLTGTTLLALASGAPSVATGPEKVLGAAAPAVAPLDPATFPDRAVYRGRAEAAAGAPLAGRHDFEIRYFDGERELLVERHAAVAVVDGRFEIELGSGAMEPGSAQAAPATLQALFARAPAVAMEFAIDGTPQAPRVHLLPGGHSAASRALLAGRSDDGKRAHSKRWARPTGATAIQAAVLRPGDPRPAGSFGLLPPAGPYEAEMIGPILSPPLRSLPVQDLHARPEVAEEVEEINRPRHEDLYDEKGVRFGTSNEEILDPLAARSRGPAGVLTPTPTIDFEGIGNVNGVVPPDTEGVVGPNHYMQVVNLSLAIFDKSGSGVPVAGPFDTNTIWSGFGGDCENANDGDAIVLYDRQADRWLISQFALPGGSERVCFAVSQSSDPTGSYYLYQVITQRFPDYFKLGAWSDSDNNAYFMSTNSGFQGQYDIYAMDRASMLAGVAAQPAQFFQSFVNLMLPADVDGALAPPAGSPGLFYTFRKGGEAYFGSPPESSLDLWAFDVDWNTPANSTFTNFQSFTPTSGGFAEFNWTVCGFFSQNCLNQPGTAQNLDSGSWWPMKPLKYRNFGGHEALVGTWTVDVTGTPDLAAPRWFELRRSGGAWSIYQQGTYSPDDSHRWFPSIAMDRDGNIALGYSVMKDNGGAGDLYPTIRYATRAAGDPLGTMQAEQTLVTGSGSQTTFTRWGDYSSMTVDPEDDCTFWYTSEYLATTGSAPWQTRVGAFKVPGCGGLAVTPTSTEVCGTVGSIDFGIELFDEFTGSTDLSVTGCPATCGFSDDPIVDPDRDSVLTVSGLGALSNGVYNFSVQAEDADSLRDVPLAITIWAAVASVPSLTTPADGAIELPLKPTFSWAELADATAYDIQIATDAAFTNIVASASGLSGTSFQPATNLDPDTTHYWRVSGDNACGSAGYSSTWSFTTGIPRILLVDDDNNAPDVLPTYQALLAAVAINNEVWNATAVEPTAGDLAGFEAAIWFSGDRFCGGTSPCAGPQAAAEAALATFLDGGSCLLISAQDYLWDMGGGGADVPTAFMTGYLGYASGDSDTGDYTSVDGRNVYAATGNSTLTYPSGFFDFSDILVSGAGAQLAFEGNNANDAAISKLGPNWFTTYLGFGLETLPAAKQQAVLQKFLTWCEAARTMQADDFESNGFGRWDDVVGGAP